MGGMDRGASSPTVGGPLDVLAVGRLIEAQGQGWLGAPSVLETPVGLLTSYFAGGCVGLRMADPLRASAEVIELRGCNAAGRFVAYDAASDTAFLCVGAEADAPVLIAYDPDTLEVRWDIRPSRDLGALGTPGGNVWFCGGPGLDEARREIVVPFTNLQGSGTSYGHRLAILDADTGEVKRVVQVPAASTDHPALGVIPVPGPRSVSLERVTLTEGGIIARGRTLCAQCAANSPNVVEGVVAWFTREGSFRGARYARTPTDTLAGGGVDGQADRTPAASEFAVGLGALGLIAMGGHLLLINPATPEPVADVPIAAVEPTSSFVIWPAATRVASSGVVALPHSVYAVDPTSLTNRWAYTEGQSWRVVQMAPVGTGSLLVLLANEGEERTALAVLDGNDGSILHRIEVPIVPARTNDGIWYGEMSVLKDGRVVVTDNLGSYALLGRADPLLAPRVAVSNPYPAPGETIDIALPSAAASYKVLWERDASVTVPPGETVSHAFVARGIRDVMVTAVERDGTTATAVLTVEVGGTPPPQLTPLQRAFAPENQEMTFFVLGTLITVIGLAVTIGRHRRRFSRLEQELAAVEEIRLLSTTDPHGAVQALKAYRERLPGDLARRRIDDSQYQVLDIRSARLLKVLRTRMFAPYDTRLSMRYHRLLDAAFEDAILQPSEAAALVAALDQEEALRPGDRQEIERLLAEFTSHNVAAALR